MLAEPVSKEEIVRAKAHTLWLEEGCPDGRAESHWLRAVEIVELEFKIEPAQPKRAKAAPRKRG